MAKFCGKCGSPRDSVTGQCPKCGSTANAAQSAVKREIPAKPAVKPAEKPVTGVRQPKAGPVEKAEGNAVQPKKASAKNGGKKKKSKKATVIIIVSIVLCFAILVSTVSCALEYFDIVNIPIAEKFMNAVGITDKEKEEEKTSEEKNQSISADSFKDEKITNEEEAVSSVEKVLGSEGFEDAANDISVKETVDMGDKGKSYRMQQNYNGIPVFNKEVVVLTDNSGNVIYSNSQVADVGADFSTKPSADKEEIKSNIKSYAGANNMGSDLEVNDISDDNLIVYFGSDDKPVLAYQIVNDGFLFIADAESGDVIYGEALLNYTAAPCKDYYEKITVTGTKDDTDGYYYLENDYIAAKNVNKNNSHSPQTLENNSARIRSKDDIFGNESKDDPDKERELNYSKAVTFFDTVTKISDYFATSFSEPKHKAIKLYTNWGADDGKNAGGTSLSGADGSTAVIALGYRYDGDEYDIIGHEYTHSLTARHWISTTEQANAIDEGFADLFGEFFEAKAKNEEPDWYIRAEGGTYRNAKDPSANNHAATINDNATAEDYAHSYATIVTRAAYLMASGLEEKSTKIDIATLEQIWFSTLINLPGDPSFNDLRKMFEAQAENWYNLSEDKLDCIAAAFDSVGIVIPKGDANGEVIIVVDVSGSMNGDPIEKTKEAAKNSINTYIENNVNVSIVVYDDSAEVIASYSQNKTLLESYIDSISTGGGTNIESGLASAFSMLKSENVRKSEKKAIVLLSDGAANGGKTGDDLIEYAGTIKDEGIYISAMGFFDSLGSEKAECQRVMEGIGSPGYHYEISDAAELSDFFNDVADQLSGQKYYYIKVACPVDVRVFYQGESLNSREDSLNKRTDFGTLTFEDIKDEKSGKSKTDENDKIEQAKVLRLKAGPSYDIEISGTGKGKMDYTIGFMDDNGEYSDMRKFSNIAITKKTEITTTAAEEDKTRLNVDEDGDGKTDKIYEAKKDSRGKLVDYTWLYLLIGITFGVMVILIAVLIIMKKVRKKKKQKSAYQATNYSTADMNRRINK